MNPVSNFIYTNQSPFSALNVKRLQTLFKTGLIALVNPARLSLGGGSIHDVVINSY